MNKIAILGANGQVGTEVCLWLRHWSGVQVVGICRNQLAGSVLRRLGVDCRIGNVADVAEAERLVGDCDLIADFTLPGGNHQQAVTAHRRIVQGAQAAMSRSAPYVFISTQMAFGFSQHRPVLRHYWLPGTSYGAIKRAVEKIVRRTSKRYDRDYYILRLGQVHGLLQNVTLSLQQIARDPKAKFRVPDGPSSTIFCFTIAEALANISRGLETANTNFTAVSNPAWSWQEVLEFCGARNVDLLPFESKGGSIVSRIATRVRTISQSALVQQKDFIQANVLRFAPKLEHQLKVKNWCNKARQCLSDRENEGLHELNCFIGELPGKRLRSLSDSRRTMDGLANLCRQSLDNLASSGTSQD